MCTSSDYSYRIGMVLYKQAKYENAAYFFSQGFSESVDCKQDFAIVFRRQELLNNQALCYTRLEKLDSALIIYRKALAYINQNDTISERKVLFDVARGVVLGNIGGVYAKMKSYRAAEEYLKKSIRINIRPSYENNDAALTQVKLARLYLDLNSLKKAEVILQDLRTSVGKLNLPEASRSYHYLYAQYLKKIGDHSGAYHHLWRYTKMADSAQKVLAATNSPDINERFQNLDSRTEINFLKKEQELQQIYLVITILLALMAIVIILLIYFYWRKSRKTVDMLTQLNNTVQEQKLQLEDTLLNLENSDKEKDSLLRAVAHDLRNPIGGISSLVELMIAEDTDKEVKQQHQLIKDTCLNTLELINELIEASENQNPVNVVDKLSSIDIVGLVANAVELLKFKAREKHQQIKFDTIQSPIVVNVNPEKILRVINNLISNAIKFSHENSTIEVSIAITNQHVKITVSDYGIGIPLAMQENVFQMFTPAKRFGTKGEKSYGLGLSISKQIINAHKGEIWFEPNDNGGTRFCFSLPI
jgi:signal transduction histidine kinase